MHREPGKKRPRRRCVIITTTRAPRIPYPHSSNFIPIRCVRHYVLGAVCRRREDYLVAHGAPSASSMIASTPPEFRADVQKAPKPPSMESARTDGAADAPTSSGGVWKIAGFPNCAGVSGEGIREEGDSYESPNTFARGAPELFRPRPGNMCGRAAQRRNAPLCVIADGIFRVGR